MSLEQYQADVLHEFRRLKKHGDAAMAQVSDEDFFKALDANSNSIALIVKHISGNLHSRWQDFLTTDGEAPAIPGTGFLSGGNKGGVTYSMPSLLFKPVTSQLPCSSARSRIQSSRLSIAPWSIMRATLGRLSCLLSIWPVSAGRL